MSGVSARGGAAGWSPMEKPRLVSLQQRRGWGAVLVLSGVLALGDIGKARNMGNVSSCCINAKRGFRFVVGCGIRRAGETPLRTFAAGERDCRPEST